MAELMQETRDKKGTNQDISIEGENFICRIGRRMKKLIVSESEEPNGWEIG